MRPKATDNVIIYIRFRKDLDEIITKVAIKRGLPKATLVRKAMTEWMTEGITEGLLQFQKSSLKHNRLSSLSSVFFAKRGRAHQRNIGNPMRVTLKRVVENNIRLAAHNSGYTITEFRTAIMVTWLINNKEI